jgi:hypothetical protein
MPAVQNKAQINRELQRIGLGKLSDPKLFDQMAFLVRDHDHFRGMLMHETPSDRAQMYQCLAPRLRFKAKPLEDYEAESKRIAEEKQLPQYNPANLECREITPYHAKTEEFVAAERLKAEAERFVDSMRKPEVKTELHVPHGERSVLSDAAERAIARDLRESSGTNYQLTLVCCQCTFEQKIRVKRKPAAYKLAKQDGWTWLEHGKKALCFACSKSRVN